MLWTKEIPHCAYKFEASEENRIVYESLYCVNENIYDINSIFSEDYYLLEKIVSNLGDNNSSND